MRILVIGAGGREHAMAQVLRAGHHQVHAAPGNPGMREVAETHAVASDDIVGMVNLARDLDIDYAIVGPELPLVKGLVDSMLILGVPVFGPTKAAAEIEGSKSFAKQVMNKAGIACPDSNLAYTPSEVQKHIEKLPVVLKADGLASGKGVWVCHTQDQVAEAIHQHFIEERFGSMPMLVEEYLEGREISLLALCDGRNALPLASAQDYSRLLDNDQGPNTGGMGAYSPTDIEYYDVHTPILEELDRQGRPFHGVLYAGCILTSEGLKVLEYNARFGDPEAQVILPRLKGDLGEILFAATVAEGLSGMCLEWDPQTYVCVCVASQEYPHSATIPQPIEIAEQKPNSYLLHAGTSMIDGKLHATGGRVLNAMGHGADLISATHKAYQAIDTLNFKGMQYRQDIGNHSVSMG